MLSKNAGFGTVAIHAGIEKDQYNSLGTPIYQSVIYRFDTCEQGGNRFAGTDNGYIGYPRYNNPTTAVLERKIAALEGAEAALAFGSGIGAITSAMWSIVKATDHIVADETLYGSTHSFMTNGLSLYGVDVTFVDCCNLREVKDALRPETVIVYIETPANPSLKIIDIKAVADLAHDYNSNIKVIADNTFATPFLQTPLKLGCDVVLHSATKYINGHGDACAGIACGTVEFIKKVRAFGLREMTGASLGQSEAYLVIRGLKTLEIRMERHCGSAMKVAEFLDAHPKVEKVYYPGLETHSGHDIAKKQMRGFGGMVSFVVKGGKQAATALLNNLRLCVIAVSLGDTETLVEHPASMSHFNYTAEDLAAAGIPEGLIRISVGLENPEDIIEDFEQSFTNI